MKRLLILGAAKMLILQTITFLGLLAAVVVLLLQVGTNRHLTRDGKQAHDALCVFKADLGQRVNASREFLTTHPQGIPGIPAAVIRTSVMNQQATLDSLSALTCP